MFYKSIKCVVEGIGEMLTIMKIENGIENEIGRN